MTRKNQLQAHIIEYKRRREAVKKKYPKGSPLRVSSLKRIRETINNYRRKIKKIEAAEKQLQEIHRQACLFFSRKTLRNGADKTAALLRAVFSKYVLENCRGVRGWQVSEYLRYSDPRQATRLRLRFTQSFMVNREAYATWKRFKQFLQEQFISLQKAA